VLSESCPPPLSHPIFTLSTKEKETARRLKGLRIERLKAPKANFPTAHFCPGLALREEIGQGLLRALD
jgi:hypothetical protein